MAIPTSRYQYSIKLFDRIHIISAQHMLLAILGIGIVLRVMVAFLLGNDVTPLPGLYDQISYDNLAQRLVSGYGFSFAENHWPMTLAGEPTAHWSFLYTGYLAVIYAFFGHQPVIARLLQAILVGGLQTYLTYLIAEKAFSRTVGLIAAAITALYAYFVYYSGALMTEPFYITAILSSLLLAIQLAETDHRPRDVRLGIGLGISLAVTVILRQVFLLFLPFLFLWVWSARVKRGLAVPILATIMALGLVILCILPISLYNQSRFGKFVLLNTNSGYAFFWGNHPIHETHFIPILSNETYRSLIPEDLHGLDEAALDQALLKRGLQFVLEEPNRFILLSISRIPAYFMFWPSSDSGLISNLSRVLSFGVLFPFMLYGLALSARIKAPEKRVDLFALFISPTGLLLLFALLYTSIHLLTWALIRYRLPVDAVLVPFAALAFSDILQRIRSRNRSTQRAAEF